MRVGEDNGRYGPLPHRCEQRRLMSWIDRAGINDGDTFIANQKTVRAGKSIGRAVWCSDPDDVSRHLDRRADLGVERSIIGRSRGYTCHCMETIEQLELCH